MEDQIEVSVQKGLEYLAANQSATGRFAGLASPSSTSFSGPMVRATDTIFFTALILDCLLTIPGAATLRAKSAQYLLAHRSDGWTWNYWERSSGARPYPDDIDDTACCVAAIVGHDASVLGARGEARLAQCLVSCETKPGGPYQTWLAAPQQSEWSDVDIVVNANVGHMFARLGVNSLALERYVSECISNNQLESRYYLGIVPTLYFIARWYRGYQQDALVRHIVELLKYNQSPLSTAMLVSAACNLGRGNVLRPNVLQRLIAAQHKGSWPASALYYEPPEQGSWRYAGSPELTTAFVLEALTLWIKPAEPTDKPVSIKPPRTLDQLYRQQREALLAANRREITDPAGIWAHALGLKRHTISVRDLNNANVDGWLAYTIYDDLLDDEGDLGLLGVANMAMRRSVNSFVAALQNQGDFTSFVQQVFASVDRANTWEVLHARDPECLPNYRNLHKLAERSWGHILAPTGVMLLAGHKLDSPEVTLMHNFMRHYLIARQLADDAHDWQQDLQNNQMTAVVSMLLKSCPASDMLALQLYFWQHTVLQVNKLIRKHLRNAQANLDKCRFVINGNELQAWLDGVEAVCCRAEVGRQESLDFISTFTSPSLVN